MPNAFPFSLSPFDCLDPDEQRRVRASVDIAYFPQHAAILEPGDTPAYLFVIVKGYVQQLDDGDAVATLGPDDCFDGRSLVAGRVSSRFVAAQEVVAYQLARHTVIELIASNATFGALLFADLGHKLSVLAERQQPRELPSLSLSRVGEAFLRPVHSVPAHTDILSVVRLMREQRTSSVVVCDEAAARKGIFSRTLLQQAILDGRPLQSMPVGDWARYPLIEVRSTELLGDAMALMLRHRIHRLVVEEGGVMLGVLEALDLLSYLSNQSHIVTLQIEQARDLQSLGQAASQMTKVIAQLFRSGSRVELIARLVQQLNARLFERAWQLIAPADLVANSCLFVMGSEGRGEQLLKTDQDNGLILRDGYMPPEDLQGICERFSQALGQFGYPPCPGHIMLSNPAWRRTAKDFAAMLRQWVWQPAGDNLMHLAIFMDAHAVAGDADLLAQVSEGLHQLATDNDALLSRFAAAMDAFGTHGGWLSKLFSLGEAPAPLHLKKEGLFPLLHGVRSLALAHHVRATSTVARVQALVAQGALSPGEGEDVLEALHVFMALKLKAGLAEQEQARPVTGTVSVQHLSSLDRDLLKDALGVVKRFQQLLRTRFHLGAL
ncbi:CBS domain-containing protein [Acidovorax sp. DW039]|uniref:DUF294 nucleotidyltransferase-like domain-containing protein n=1 Tax=Acidovorax sp. DW039 TaxID=3095606 RepID=UPI0030883D2F|nr:CBS domain-containing protein [Acidovorax sp. DW039]